MDKVRNVSINTSPSTSKSFTPTTTNTGTTIRTSGENMTKYHMYYTASRMNVKLHKDDASTPAVYYLKSVYSWTKLMLELRRGDTKASPMIAFAKLRMTSRHVQIGKGDNYSQQGPDNQIAWDELRRAKNIFCRSDYHFSTAEGSEMGKKTEFDWRKDRGKVAATVYDCVDKTGRAVAKMFSGGALNWSKAGEIEVAEEGLDEGLKEMLITSALAIWAMEAFAYQSVFQGYASGPGEKKSEAANAHQA
ncbi:MAG: hypothetical protein LQ341_006850 [Variospora aurantia]|nr:MAG: hypothetical protein LQ341_006850 [Variospora aurantia]